MVLTTIATLSGLRLGIVQPLRSLMVMVLGVLLGSAFTPDVIQSAREWPVTLATLLIYLGVVTGTMYLYFRRAMGFDPVTAYFSATPGGLNEMVIAGAAMGGDDRTIALVHAARVLLVVMVIPLGFRYATGVSPQASDAGPALFDIGLAEFAILVACAATGAVAGKLLRLPAYKLVGPMLVSAAVHAAGVTSAAPPWPLVAAAQVVLGAAVGARFSGVPLRRVLKTLAASVGSTTLMLIVTFAFALALSSVTGIEWPPIVLAYAPGGLAEMSLIALALGVETAFVATHHVVRIGLIVTLAPLVFRLAPRRER